MFFAFIKKRISIRKTYYWSYIGHVGSIELEADNKDRSKSIRFAAKPVSYIFTTELLEIP
jgi:hypothetical protein